jgi:hypothetical protein
MGAVCPPLDKVSCKVAKEQRRKVNDILLSDSVAWRKPYQDIQDLRMYRMRKKLILEDV